MTEFESGAGDNVFTLPTLATLFLPYVDGHRSLAEIGELVRQQISRDAGSEFLAHAAEELHATPDELLASAALTLASEMRPAGAATFEWAD